MVDSLRNKVALMDTQFANANEAWKDLRNSMDGEVSEETARNFVAMNEHLDACGSSLAAFKITNKEDPPAKAVNVAAEASLEPIKIET
jgi:hypothetical protein